MVCLLQVWNMNAVNGVLGVFNAQGATWSRQQRRFVTHDKRPGTLQTIARPHDIDTFRVQHAATASTDESTTGAGAAAAGRQFAVYSDRSGALQLLSVQEGVQVRCSRSVDSLCMPARPPCSRMLSQLLVGGLMFVGLVGLQHVKAHTLHCSRLANCSPSPFKAPTCTEAQLFNCRWSSRQPGATSW